MKTSGTTRDNEWQRVIKNDKEWQQLKSLNSGHLWVLKNLSVIKRYPLLGGSLTKIVIFGTKHFVHYSRHDCYLGCPLLGSFTVSTEELLWSKQVLLHSISFFRRATFLKNLLFLRATFLEWPIFQKILPSIAATFSEELFFTAYFFRRVAIS